MARSLQNIYRMDMDWPKVKYRLKVLLAAAAIVGALQATAFAKVSDIPPMPYPRVGMCAARVEGTIYLIGGAQGLQGRNIENLMGTSTVQAFNFDTKTWETNIAPLETPRVFACAVMLNDSIYVMGGVDSLGNVLSSVEVYDPSLNKWHYATSMKLARKGAAAVAFDSYIFVFGGGGMMGSPYSEVEAYSVENGTWKVTYPMALARAYHKVFRVNGSVYIFGGNSGTFGLVNVIERYVPTIGTVEIAVTLRSPRMLFGIAEKEDSVFVISGQNGTGNADIHIELLDFHQQGAERDTVISQTLSSPRVGFVAAVGGDGQVYIFGGISPDYKNGQVAVPDITLLSDVTPVNEVRNTIPDGFTLDQNYPNPFNPTTNIRFDVPSPGSRVSLDVYNMLGQKVKTLAGGYFHAGTYSVSFNGANMPSGAYIYRLQTETGSIYRKMVLIK